MSETILKALMRLFAIIANVNKDGVSDTSRSIVESFLKQQLNQQQVQEYLQFFDEYLEVYHRDIVGDNEKGRKRTSSNSVKVLKICQTINEALEQEQKVIVLLQLLEFISFGAQITEKELDFTKTVGDTFNISELDYLNAKAFILDSVTEIVNKDNLLIIDKDAESHIENVKHIQSKNLEGRIYILQLNSANIFIFRYIGETDLLLNGHNILLNRSYILTKGATIRSPKINTIYYSDVVSEYLHSKIKTTVTFSAIDVEYRFKTGEIGLHKFNFSEEGGQLIGIMGGSGVGKSTLLNVLNGNYKPETGKVLINGYDLHAEGDMLQGFIGFVPQDDLLIEELTVYQNLYYNARLCMSQLSDQEINLRVDKMLEDLELIETKNLTVGSPLNKFISGGQRKRLNIALELIREPQILFVDEPTSGLSSMDSEMVMDMLKEQALKGKLVIINIHQPSSEIYKMFDKLLILDKGGYLIYNGNPIDAVVYFKTISNHVNPMESECITCGNVNPEQVLQIVEAKVVDEYGKLTRVRKISPIEWYDLFLKHISEKIVLKTDKKELVENQFKIPGKFGQFKIFTTRNILTKLTNRQYMLINFLETPLLAFILAFFTKYIAGTEQDSWKYIFSLNENIPIFIFMSVVVALFVGLTVSAEEIIRDRLILKREKFLNLSHFSYINSKVIVLFAISAIQTVTFILVGNSLMGIKGMFFEYWLILFSTACCANMIGLNISAGLNSVVTIYILIPFLLVPQLLFSGTMVKFDKLHKRIASYQYVPVLGDMMPSRWAYEALAVNQFKNNEFEKHFFDVDKIKSQAAYITSFLIPQLVQKADLAVDGKPEEKENSLKILRHELTLFGNKYAKHQYSQMDLLTTEKYNLQVAADVKEHLQKVKSYYNKLYNKASSKRDGIIENLIAEKGGKEKLDQLKENYHNEMLANFVLNKQELQKIIENDGMLIQTMDPVFRDPEARNGRAHFYASEKHIGNISIDTLWFNTMVLWLLSFVLYLTLYFDVIKRIIEYNPKQ